MGKRSLLSEQPSCIYIYVCVCVCVCVCVYVCKYIYIYTHTNNTNIPPVVIINRVYEHQNLLSL